MELWNFETSEWDSLKMAMKRSEMNEAEDNFMEAVKTLEKAEKELYLSVYWLNYAQEHKN